MLIVACPGQGSQTPGFLTPWLDEYPALNQILDGLGAACGADLIRLGTSADEDEIKDTANAQRLIVGSSVGIYRAALGELQIHGVLGHSVGEFAAAAIAGVLTDEDAMRLVGQRADAMAAAAAEASTSMAAVLGGDEAAVLEVLTELGLEPANFNGAGQLVVAGRKTAVTSLIASPPERARVIELKVAGAFHTSFMDSAKAPVQELVDGLEVSQPQVSLWSNVDGQLVQSGQEFVQSLVSQISSPVRWDKCMESLTGSEATVIEMPPAGALAGLLKRGVADATAIALKTPADLEKVPNP